MYNYGGLNLKIRHAVSSDVIEYTKIYKEYLMEQIQFVKESVNVLADVYQKVDFIKRNEDYINSQNTLVYVIENEKKEFVGFIEYNMAKADSLFEYTHVYVSNIYLKKEIRKKEIFFPLAKQLMEIGENWARQNGIKYMCNDILEENQVMKHINQMLGFSVYKIRYVKEV